MNRSPSTSQRIMCNCTLFLRDFALVGVGLSFWPTEQWPFLWLAELRNPLVRFGIDCPPDMGHQHGITGAYADNISIVGSSSLAVQQARDSISTRFEKDDIYPSPDQRIAPRLFWKLPEWSWTSRKQARNKPRRLWRAFLADQAILRKRRVSIRALEIWLGHMTSLSVLQPAFLPCFFHTYWFIQRFWGRRAEVWREVKAEIRLALGTM